MRLRMDHTKDLAPPSTLEEVLESIRALDKNILSQETSSIGRFPQPMRARTLLGSALDALTMPVDSTVTLSKRTPTTTQTIRENPKSFTEQLQCQSYDASQVAAFSVLGKTERASEARNTVKSEIENRVDPVSENATRSSQLNLPVHKYGYSAPGPCASNRKFTSSGPMVAPKKWKDDSAPEMKKNSRVWYSTAEDKWILGTILSVEDGGVTVRIRTADGHVLETSTAKLQPANPDLLEGVDDLIQLTYLNQPAILHNIAYRYQKDIFYIILESCKNMFGFFSGVEAVSLEKIVVTKQGLATRYCKTRAGPVLIAVNPFKRVPIYSLDFIQAYRKRSGESLHPHVYMTTENAFEAMVRDDVNQSIIISGESGAGKTETAKITMQYLAALGGGGGLEDEILQTNPILEAFGNAKTLRNDNSSRFGKLIDIHFDGTRKICGAKIQTYLLEKSRVVQQAMDERSYHIFYQLCAGADHALRERIYLKPAKDFRYLIQSSCLTINHVDDAEQFHVMTRAMDVVQISKEDQEAAFEMISAVLWLGNITFSVREQDNHVTVDDNEAVNVAASLLHCKVGELIRALSTHKIRAGTEDIVQRLTYSQAVDSRDTLAKAIYANLFDWLVDRINKSLKVGKWRTGRCISILDIYGFESFKVPLTNWKVDVEQKNSFEQLCINYANERLQQHFNRHLFKLEQEEYTNERIDWTRVDFEDNKECLDLIEKRPLGLISLLDEECTFPRATDVTLAEKLIEHLKSNSCFKGERSKAFRICHYAGQVVYDTSGFLEKNRDVLHADLLQLLASCDSSLPRLFAESIGEIVLCNPMLTPRSGGPETQKQSVATKFKRDERPPKSQLDTSPQEHPYVYGIWQGQLNKLMQRLENTAPHFIRCIKPNTLQLPHIFEQELVLQQLRCCGVLEVVRISRSGYPSRHLHQQFADRYEFLLPQSLNSQQDMLSLCVTILRHFGISPEMYQIGLTKLFFRVGQIGILEDVRQQTLHGIISVQKVYKGYAIRNQYKQLQKVAILLQSMARGAQARRHYKKLLLRHEAAVIIQKNVRMDAACHNYYVTRNTIIKLQAVVRGWLLRRRLQKCKQEAGTDFAATEAGELEEDPDGYFVQVSAEDEASSVEVDDELLLELPGISSSSSSPTHTSRPSEMGLLELNEDPGTGVQSQYLLELQQRATMAEKALLQKEEENVILRHRLQHHESLWPEYEDKVLALEIMWQKQMRSLQQTLSTFQKCLSTDEPGRIITHKLEASNCNVVPRRRASRHLLIREDDDFDWDDDTTVGAKSPENSFTPRDYTPSVDQEFATCRGELDAGQSAVVDHLIQEFKHRTQVFNDDADFLVEVKSGLTEASLNPDEELRKLKGRFDTWKKDFKLRLRETRVVLQKLGNLENAEKTKRNWWGRRTHP